MPHDKASILDVLDQCAGDFTFPALDNGYLYMATSRMSLHYSPRDWALVFEIFGYNPRAGLPSIYIETVASRIHNRHIPETYTPEQRENYLIHNPHNDFVSINPIPEGDWMDQSAEMASIAGSVEVRGQRVLLPTQEEYVAEGIVLQESKPAIFEVCRYLAARHRDAVLATRDERRVSIAPELDQILVLDDWHHPDVIGGQLPSQTQTFRQIAQVLADGDVSLYAPAEPLNTHWKFWPGGGSL
ncbi:MAG TPA: hypothetical protein VGL72_07725 [Bryobacteraceae bacterium]|jgi:hypothetical protein